MESIIKQTIMLGLKNALCAWFFLVLSVSVSFGQIEGGNEEVQPDEVLSFRTCKTSEIHLYFSDLVSETHIPVLVSDHYVRKSNEFEMDARMILYIFDSGAQIIHDKRFANNMNEIIKNRVILYYQKGDPFCEAEVGTLFFNAQGVLLEREKQNTPSNSFLSGLHPQLAKKVTNQMTEFSVMMGYEESIDSERKIWKMLTFSPH